MLVHCNGDWRLVHPRKRGMLGIILQSLETGLSFPSFTARNMQILEKHMGALPSAKMWKL